MSTFRNANCLITGADGFLGAHLVKALVEAGANVVGAMLSRKGESSLSALGLERAITLEYGDVTDAAFVQRLVNAHEVDHVFHLAAVSAVRVASACPERAFRTNVLGTLNILEACRASGRPVRSIVVASSDKAYGVAESPYYEDLRLEPRSPYEASKAAAEMVCRAYRYEYGLPVAITRCANLYGPADLSWSRVVPGSIRRAINGEAAIVYAESALARREMLHVSDAVRVYLLLASKARDLEAPEHNVGSGETVGIHELVSRLALLVGGPPPVLVPRPGAFTEIPDQQLSSWRMQGLGWAPQVRLADGLVETVEWYRRYFVGERPLLILPRMASGRN